MTHPTRWRGRGSYTFPVLFSPYTGEPRDARDIASDPQGLLIVQPGAPLVPAAPTPPVQQDGYAAGIEAVAAMIEAKAQAFADQYGADDMGSLSFGSGSHAEAKTDYHSSLVELVDEVRAMNSDAPPPPAQHSDDAAVDRFAAAMKAKLAQKRAEGRGGWDDPEQCPVERLAGLLHQHVSKGDPIDVANFAMMLWCRGGEQ